MDANTKEIRRSLRSVRSSIRGKVHKSVYVRVDNICRMVEILLSRADELGVGSHDMHVLSRTATDYLPSAIRPYLALPREFAERLPQADGRTAIQILCSQLDVMYAQLWQVYDSVMRRDGDRLLAHERFLTDKFGGNPLQIPPDPPGTGHRAGSTRRDRRRGPDSPRSEDWDAVENLIRAGIRQLAEIVRARRNK